MKKIGGTKVSRRETLLQSALKNSSGPQNELETAWDSLGKAKSILRQVDHKMMDISKPSSADILWHLPDFLFCLVDQENLKDLPRSQLQDPSYLLSDSVTASPVKRKVSYKDNRENSQSQYDSIADGLHSNSTVPTDDSCRPTSAQNMFAKNTLDISSISTPSSNARPLTSAWSTCSRDVTRDVTADLTSSTAVRDTDIRFLNDIAVQPKKPVPQDTAKPPRFHHVEVIIPAGYSKKKTDGLGRKVTIRDPPDDVKQETKCGALSTAAASYDDNSRMPLNTKFSKDEALYGQLDAYSDSSPDGAVIGRKVANGPPAPAHKGFNEPQNRIRASPVSAKGIKAQLTFNSGTDANRPETQTRMTDSTLESAKKRERVVAIGNSEAAKKDIITTNSWRAGAKLRHDLGLTFAVAPKPGKAETANESKKTEKSKDQDLSRNASIPDIAKKILEDLQTGNEITEEKKKKATKKLYKKKPTTSAVETSEEKPTKVVLYDANDARKYIRKQKEQRRKDRMEKKESEKKMKLERQQRLEELSKRQHEAAQRSLHKKSANAMNSMHEIQTTRNEEQSSADDDDDDESGGDYSDENEISDKGNDSMRKKRPETNSEANLWQQSGLPKVFGQTPASEDLKRFDHTGNTDGPASDDDDLTAQEIVSRFAIKSGLTMEDVVTNYAKYADDIMRSFIAKDHRGSKSKGVRQKTDEWSVRPKSSSVSSRLEAILHSSKSLQSRLNTEARRFATDPVMHSGANVLAAQRIPKDSFNNFENASNSTGVVFESDLPGSNYRPVVDSPTLAQSVPGMFSSGFVYHVKQNDLTEEQQEALFKKQLQTSSSNKESCPFYLRPPLGQLTNKMDSPLLIPAKLVPSWNPSVTEADPLSILNIFSRRSKSRLIMNEGDGDISGKPSAPNKDSLDNAMMLEMMTEKEPVTLYLSVPSVGHQKITDEDVLSLIPERDASVSTLWKRDEELSTVGKKNFFAVHPVDDQVERIQIEAEDDASDDVASVPPIFTQRSDPWPITPRSEVMSNRSEGVSYTTDFTDAADVTDDEKNHSNDHLGDRSGDHSVGWSGTKGDDDQFDFKEGMGDEEARALSTNSDISSLTNSEFSNVTSVTLDSALLNQQSRSLSQIQHALPLIGATLAEPVLAPVALEARMSAELNLLDSMDEVLQQVSSMERTRAVALAQQETVALAQVLKARQQSQNQEVESARVKLERDSLDESRRLQSRLAEAAEREHDAAVTRIQATADAVASLQDAMYRLTQTQADAAQLTADAAKKLAEASAVALESQQDRPEMRQLLTASAAAAASGAVMSVIHQLQLQQRPAPGKERTSISSESQRKSSKRSHRPVSSARSDRSVKSEKSVASSVQTSEYDSGSETATVSAKRSRKSSSVSTEAGLVVGMDLSRPGSVQSVAVDSEIQTASDMSKVSRKSRMSVVTDKMSEHAKSVATASDVSSEENTLEASLISTEQRARSVGSASSRATEQVQSEKDYATDYDSVTTEDELEKSLREIVPSESQRKKIKKDELKLNISSGSKRTSTSGASSRKQSPGNNSFDRFNVAMVKQYLKEEAVRHQHKQMLLELREKALKEKTAAELAWLEQQKQKLRSKGLDDRYPELSKKQNAILRKHKKYQEELNRLKVANQMTLEAQKLLLSETHGVDRLQKSVQQVKQRLKSAAAAADTLPDLSITTDEDASVSLIPKDETDVPGKGDDGRSYDKEYETNETMKQSDRERLIEHEKSLQRKFTRFEKLLQESPRLLKKDLESKHNQRFTGKKRDTSSPRPLDSARSIATASDALASARTETARSNRLGSVSEDLATDRSFSNRNARSSAASITEEVSTARSVNTVRSNSQDSSASSLKSVESITEQLSRPDSTASKTQKSSRIQSPKTSKSIPQKKRNQLEKSSGSDDDFTLNQSVDISDRSELEGRIENLTKELKRRKKEAEELKKKQEKKRLKLEEEKLRLKLKDYDSYINEAKKELLSPASTTKEQNEQTKSIPHHHTASDSSISHSTAVQDVVSSKLRNSDLEPESGSKPFSGQHKDDDDHSQANTRRSSMSEDVVEELSLASLSADGEKVLLDLDLRVLDQNQRSGQQSMSPRSTRSDARIPESARTLADIPEDYSLQDDLNSSNQVESQGEPSEKMPSRSIQSQDSARSAASYTEDFSENSISLDDGLEQSIKKADKLSESDRKTGSAAKLSRGEGNAGSAKVAVEENESTDEDMCEEILSVDESQVDSEEDEVEEIKIAKDDDSVVPDANLKLAGNTNSPKDNDPISAEPVISDKEVKKVDYEEVTKRTLDMLLKETIDELVRIKRQKSDTIITEDKIASPVERNPLKTKSFSAANEKKDFLDDKYSFDDDGDWDIPTKFENDAAVQNQLPVIVEPVATVVPHSKEEVVAMVNSAVDFLWNNKNSCNRSWDNLKHEVASRSDSDDAKAAQSKASYSRLVFDLTAEALCTIYMDDSMVAKPPWCLPKVAKGTRHHVKPVGVTAEQIKPTVQERVLRWLGLADQISRRPRPIKKFRRRRGCQPTRSDQLDELVLEDLHEEESGWVDYSQDELNIKMELADSIFDSVLRETVSLLTTLKSKKQN